MKKEIGKLSRKTFEVDVLSDPYAARLTTLVERKFESGEGVVSKEKIPEEPDGGKVIDLMEVLKKSFEAEAEESSGRKRGKPGRGKKKRPDLDRKTKSELYDMAQDIDIPNRSRMSKDELIRAIRKAS